MNDFTEIFTDIIKHTITISCFVIAMMLIIEYITVQTKGKWSKSFRNSTWFQILFAGIMGLIPGCLGTFTVVSMYSHRILNFAALVTVMIASSGDEAFMMFSLMSPYKAVSLMLLLFIIAVITGLILNFFMEDTYLLKNKSHIAIHKEEPECSCFQPNKIINQLKNMSFQRALLIIGVISFILFLFIGYADNHGFTAHGDHVHENHHNYNTWDWKRIIFMGISIISLFIVATVPDHFLSKHLWDHILKKHLLKIVLWTFGTLLFINLGIEYLHLKEWMNSNYFTILIVALLVGIIPESGPHLFFLIMFVSGNLPFSILLANSIVQDGHGAIPLLANQGKALL